MYCHLVALITKRESYKCLKMVLDSENSHVRNPKCFMTIEVNYKKEENAKTKGYRAGSVLYFFFTERSF